jgi:hypothetical protein
MMMNYEPILSSLCLNNFNYDFIFLSILEVSHDSSVNKASSYGLAG